MGYKYLTGRWVEFVGGKGGAGLTGDVYISMLRRKLVQKLVVKRMPVPFSLYFLVVLHSTGRCVLRGRVLVSY